MDKDVIILGAGAAGLFCAAEAGKRGRRVLVIEHAEKVGKKILISGGGRCNFTNIHATPENYLSENPSFCKSALARYTPDDFIKHVERHGIHYHEKKLGQLFCDGSSREIVRMLMDECAAANVEVRTCCTVSRVEKNRVFTVETNQGTFTAASLVIATGGLSIPKMGATDYGYKLARQFGLRLTPLRPALVPFVLPAADLEAFGELSGISINAAVTTSDHQIEFEENVLVTHRGLSGPAVLQISTYWNEGESIKVRLLPEVSVEELLFTQREEAMELATVLSEKLPRRFAQKWCELYAPSKPMNRFSTKELAHVAHSLANWQIYPSGTEGFAKAEVTRGGIDTNELSSKTMEAKRVPGMYFIGEVVDVTGHLGGYNFQWAWASGFAAGQCV
ncbi:MAG: NAD(P)/FAD-dependent oxidoreductase [Pyrinomonadaceae bacterium]|jgi:predicted Rossmann fold flavoprotein|nr:NAD(P)/FAD-dependent oxidoreductase [Pyrinomonadaceae bacterium]